MGIRIVTMNDLTTGPIATFFVVSLLALLHVYYPRFATYSKKVEHQILSFSAGIALGYVFLYLLPKIALYTSEMIAADPSGWKFLDLRLYLISLFGLITYYVVDRSMVFDDDPGLKPVLVMSTGFAFYNLLIGYLIGSYSRAGFFPYGMFAFVMAMHLMGIDHQLRVKHQAVFDRHIRWLLAVALIIGYLVGTFLHLDRAVVIYGTAFLAGGMIINVLTEEFPALEPRRLQYFVIGIVFFILFMMVVTSL